MGGDVEIGPLFENYDLKALNKGGNARSEKQMESGREPEGVLYTQDLHLSFTPSFPC
jgi:hypothetical protein